MQSKYENLPVYKRALDLAVYFEKTVKGFDRYFKYTVGTDLRNQSREILYLIAKANKNLGRTGMPRTGPTLLASWCATIASLQQVTMASITRSA